MTLQQKQVTIYHMPCNSNSNTKDEEEVLLMIACIDDHLNQQPAYVLYHHLDI